MIDDVTRLGLIDDDDIVLDEAALALALLDHPETDLRPYRELMRAVAMRLQVVGTKATHSHQRADALAGVLGDEFQFVGDTDTYDDPANADLIRVVDRRRGLPVSLSILYVGAARRIGWNAHVLNVPGHVLVLVGDGCGAVVIDPFRRGSHVSEGQLTTLMASARTGPATAIGNLVKMDNRAVLVRLLLNQVTRAEQAGKGRRALELYTRVTAVAPSYGHAWWKRAQLEYADGNVSEARRNLIAVLEVTREPLLRHRISDSIEELPAE